MEFLVAGLAHGCWFLLSLEVITVPGYTQPVFSLPYLVDADGVLDPVTFFTRSNGRTRQRRGCFLRVSGPGDPPDRGLVLVIEGENFRARPVLQEVGRVDVRVVAQVLGKVSIPASDPSQSSL